MEWNAHNSVHLNTKTQKCYSSANKVAQKWCKFLIDHKRWMKQDLAPIAPKNGLSSTQWRSQNIAVARAQHGYTTFVWTSSPVTIPSFGIHLLYITPSLWKNPSPVIVTMPSAALQTSFKVSSSSCHTLSSAAFKLFTSRSHSSALLSSAYFPLCTRFWLLVCLSLYYCPQTAPGQALLLILILHQSSLRHLILHRLLPPVPVVFFVGECLLLLPSAPVLPLLLSIS